MKCNNKAKKSGDRIASIMKPNGMDCNRKPS